MVLWRSLRLLSKPKAHQVANTSLNLQYLHRNKSQYSKKQYNYLNNQHQPVFLEQ